MNAKTSSAKSADKKTIDTAKKATAETPSQEKKIEKGKPGTVEIRMYCIGTGDCFILRFFREDGTPFVMMIDCGSCMGDKKWFGPYVKDLALHVGKRIDLLVVTHEHQDHVNGFYKCREIFEKMEIANAWFAWTENPDDPGGAAAELKTKRKTMKAALGSAFTAIKNREEDFEKIVSSSPFALELRAARQSLLEGMDSLVKINLDEEEQEGKVKPKGGELPGMQAIKEMVKDKVKKSKPKFLI